MKKFKILLALVVAGVLFQFCSASRHSSKTPPITYTGHVASIMKTSCTPCHFPPQGNKEPLNTYATVKEEIDEIINRIQRNPGDKGFMPMRHAKLPDSTINVFVQWKNDGLLEK